jgi:hypothetical protein
MKFLSTIAVVTIFATATLAQNIVIGAPTKNTKVSPGQNITVEVKKPVSYIFRLDVLDQSLHISLQTSLTASQDIAIVIGMNTCNDTCPSSSQLGQIVHQGPYMPQPTQQGFAVQNFTVQVPSTFKTGSQVIMQIVDFSLVEAGVSYCNFSRAITG